MMKPPPDPHDGGEDSHQDAQQQGYHRRQGDVRLAEVSLPGKIADQPGVDGRAGLDRLLPRGLAPPEALQALEEHVGADAAQHDHVGDGDDEIGLSQVAAA